jgi:hypothetical protein
MYNFKRRPESAVARQFTGGFENAYELMNWVDGLGAATRTLWADADHNKPERILLGIGNYEYEKAVEGDWIIRHADGQFEIMSDEDFKTQYEAE